MQFERLHVENLGVFRGEHFLDLLPTDPGRPIVLVGALTGSGKTTFLEALQLALYGKRAGYGWRGNSAYAEYLIQLRNRHAESTAAMVAEISLRLSGGKRIRVRREWSFSKALPREFVSVYVDGGEVPDALLSETWDDEVDRLLPARLSELFFFDGERIEKLADPAKSADVLRTALSALLGLDLVDHLSEDLGILRARQKQRTMSEEDRTRIAALDAQYEEAVSKRRLLVEQRGSLKSKLDFALIERDRVATKLRDQGGDRYHQRAELEGNRSSASARVAEITGQLRSMAAGHLPLMLLREQLTELSSEASAKSQALDGRATIAVQKHVDSFEAWLSRRKYPEKIRGELADFIAKSRKSLRANASDTAGPEWTRLRHRIDSLLENSLEQSAASCRTAIAEFEAALEVSHVADERLAAVPEPEQLAALLEAKGATEAAVSSLSAEIARIDSEQEGLARDADGLNFQRTTQFEKAKDSEQAERLSEYCRRAMQTLATFRASLVQKRREQLETLILEAFQLLTRKGDLVSSVKLDTETMGISLLTPDGHPLLTQQLSAGERQLLAVAILWGLARASGRPVPVVIDTPLGRLDGEHRRMLVERYFPDASHQVILLSTDQEVDAEYSELLDQSVAHRYLIGYDEARRSSSFSAGYFGA